MLELDIPLVFENILIYPTAEFVFPLVLAPRVWYPSAALAPPVVFEYILWNPTDVFHQPLVLEYREFIPTTVLLATEPDPRPICTSLKEASPFISSLNSGEDIQMPTFPPV